VVQKLLDDPHSLNVTNSLHRPALHEPVLDVVVELGRGDALRPYEGDLAAFLGEHPGEGRLFERVPPEINRTIGPDGIERTRLSVYVEEMKAGDLALRVGGDPSAADLAAVHDYAARLKDEVKPAVDRELQAIVDIVRENTDGPVDYNSRPKLAPDLLDKVERMARGRPGAPGRPDYRVGDIVDAVGARITVPDMPSMRRALEAVERHFGLGDGGRIVEVDNMYAAPKAKNPAYRVIPLVIGVEVGGRRYAFELQLTTLRASVAADIEHNSLYKPYIVLTQDERDAVKAALREAAALDQLENGG
jgi:ppGpp synthetase/RelA/SpoT-type nucleotidyltranferase